MNRVGTTFDFHHDVHYSQYSILSTHGRYLVSKNSEIMATVLPENSIKFNVIFDLTINRAISTVPLSVGCRIGKI